MERKRIIKVHPGVMAQACGNGQLSMQTSKQECLGKSIESLGTQTLGIKLDMMTADDEPEAFLLAFECTANDSSLPREKWSKLLAPLLSGDAKAIYQALPPNKTDNYDELKNIILNHQFVNEEKYRERFRSLTLTAGTKPQTIANQLKELGKRWLKPESRSAEEIVELVIVDQFIQILPEKARHLLSNQQVWCLDIAVQLVEGFLAGEDLTMALQESVSDGGTSASKERPNEDQTAIRSMNSDDERSIEDFTEELTLHKSLSGNEQEKNLQCSLPRKIFNSQINLKRIQIADVSDREKHNLSTEHETNIISNTIANLNKVGVKGNEVGILTKKRKLRTPNSPVEHQVIHKAENIPNLETLASETYVCRICHRHFNRLATLASHQTIHARKQKGQLVNIDLQSESPAHREYGRILKSLPVQEHKEKHSVLKPKQSVESRARTSTLLSENKKPKRSIKQKSHSCVECGKCFKLNSDLVKHKRIHSGDKPHGCTDCGKHFSDPSSLCVHRRIHTNEKPYSCEDCGKCFRQSSAMRRHQLIHSGVKQYSCTECGKGFVTSAYLYTHKKVHTDLRPYKCSECGKSFNRSETLTAHKRIHTGEKPYACTKCKKCFSYPSSLRTHYRIHDQKKPYKCEECGRGFGLSSTLCKHKRIHTGEKPYTCNICGKCFSESSGLQRHKRIHIRKASQNSNRCHLSQTDPSKGRK